MSIHRPRGILFHGKQLTCTGPGTRPQARQKHPENAELIPAALRVLVAGSGVLSALPVLHSPRRLANSLTL